MVCQKSSTYTHFCWKAFASLNSPRRSRQVKAEYAAKNPMKEVPCIQIDSHLLTQSLVHDISRGHYALSHRPSTPTPPTSFVPICPPRTLKPTMGSTFEHLRMQYSNLQFIFIQWLSHVHSQSSNTSTRLAPGCPYFPKIPSSVRGAHTLAVGFASPFTMPTLVPNLGP